MKIQASLGDDNDDKDFISTRKLSMLTTIYFEDKDTDKDAY